MDLILFCDAVLFSNLHDPYENLTPDAKRKMILLDQAGHQLVKLRTFSRSIDWGFRYLRVLNIINKAHIRYVRRLKAIK
jgi:hypothetical protein